MENDDKTITWVAVINKHKALFFTKGAEKKLGELDRSFIAHPAEIHQKQGRGMKIIHDMYGKGKNFVSDVADFIESSFNKNQFNRMVLVAPPATINQLNKKFSKELRNAIAIEVEASDIVEKGTDEIQQYIESIVYI